MFKSFFCLRLFRSLFSAVSTLNGIKWLIFQSRQDEKIVSKKLSSFILHDQTLGIGFKVLLPLYQNKWFRFEDETKWFLIILIYDQKNERECNFGLFDLFPKNVKGEEGRPSLKFRLDGFEWKVGVGYESGQNSDIH